jgi:hypothetical protein
MVSLKEAAVAYSGRKELYNLDKIPVSIDFQTGSFDGKEGNKIPFTYIEIDGYKYTIKSKILEQIKNVLSVNPEAKYIKFQKAPNGEIFCIPLLN